VASTTRPHGKFCWVALVGFLNGFLPSSPDGGKGKEPGLCLSGNQNLTTSKRGMVFGDPMSHAIWIACGITVMGDDRRQLPTS